MGEHGLTSIIGQRITDVSGLLADIEPNTRHRRYWAVLDLENGDRWLVANDSAHLLAEDVSLEDLPIRDMSDLGTPIGERVERVFTRRSAPSSPGAPAWVDQLFLLLESGRVMGLLLLSGGGSTLHLESFTGSPLIRRTDALLAPDGSDISDEVRGSL